MGFKASEHDGDDREDVPVFGERRDDSVEVGEDWVPAPEAFQRSQRELQDQMVRGREQLDAAISARNRRLAERARLTYRNEQEQVEDRELDRQNRPAEEKRKARTYGLAWYGAVVATLALLVGIVGVVLTAIVLSKSPDPVAPPVAPGLEQPAPRPPSVAPVPSAPAPTVEPPPASAR